MAVRFDRRAPDGLMDALRPAGFAHSLVEYGRSGAYALDLQFRGYADRPGGWVTLYVGLTKVLDLDFLPSGFRLGAHATYTGGGHGWDPAWQQRHPASWCK